MKNSILKKLMDNAVQRASEEMSLLEFLEESKTNSSLYASAPERLLKAIGEPEIVDTSLDSRLNTIFEGRKIRRYPAFKDFFGIEEDIESIVAYLRHAKQGLEESRQILFLLGDVGTGKSSIADRIKDLMEQEPIYVIATHDGKISPVNDSPLGLLLRQKREISEDLGIPLRYFPSVLSPWGVKRLNEYGGDITKFKVIKLYPNQQQQLAVAKTEPLDDNNADIGTLIGKVSMRQLQYFNENDADAYNYSGALCRGNRGLVEMAEMYKANIKTLNPLLEASQSRSFNGLEQVGALPFDGIILSHSNKSEWSKFKSDKKNEALIDRIFLVKIHYSLRYTEDQLIMQKMLNNSELAKNPCAPRTLEILSKFNVMTRLEDAANSNLFSKMRVYNGDNIKSEDPQALPLDTYKTKASQDEGMSGHSTRKAFKILSQVFNTHIEETAADPVTLFHILKEQIIKDQLDESTEALYLMLIDEYLEPKYVEELGSEIQKAYIENSGFAQAKFDRYVHLARAYIENRDFKDQDTGLLLDRDSIHKELSELERPAGIGNYQDFRNEIVMYILGKKADGVEVKWSSYKKLAKVIEKSVFKSMKDILPIISFTTKSSKDHEVAHKKFLSNMKELGYTEHQVKRLVTYYINQQHS